MRSLIVALCLCLLALAAFAQTDRGTITGTISDPAGAVVAGAMVEAKNTDSGSSYPTASTGTGNYTLAQLPAGSYELSVTVAGFKKLVRPGIIVQVAQTVRIDATLEVGATTESVTVQAEAPLLKTESGELSHNVSYDRVDNLPLLTLNGTGNGPGNIRNPLAVVTLLPGATFSTDLALRINGLPSSSQSIRIEGQDSTNGMWRQLTQVTQSGVDAIQEVSVQTSNFAAEYGQAGGGYFNYTMKSGTNQFHGSAYDYVNNEALNAGTPFTDDGHGQHLRNAQRRNDYGFTVGGPVHLGKLYNGRDKTFFFFNFEQFREAQVIRNGVATLPTLQYRAGNFSNAIVGFFPPLPPDPLGRSFATNTVMDPSTQRVVNGQVVRDPFSNGQIPIAQQDPVALKLQALFPLPLGPLAGGAVNNYAIPAYSNNRHTTIPSFKIDHSISSTIKVSGYWSETHTTSPNSNGFPATMAPVAPQNDTSYTTRINYDQTLTPTLLLHLGAGLLYTNHPVDSPSYDQGQLWAPNQQFAAKYMPQLNGLNNFFTGGLSLGAGFFAPAPGVSGFADIDLKDIKPTFNSSLTWVKGNHTYKAGAEFQLEGFPQQSFSRANGIYTFGGIETSNPWENGQPTGGLNTGFAYASFLMGRSNSLLAAQPSDTRLGQHSFGLFVQDTWKITRKLTLDYGLRYDYVTLLREQYGRMGNAAFNLPNPAAGGRLGTVIYEATCKCSFNHNYPWAFGPRIGMAYQITPKTVLRVGGGISYSTSPNNAFLSYSVADYATVGAPGYGEKATQLSQGNPYAPGNVFGNPQLIWPDFRPNYPAEVAPGIRPPQSPFISIDRNAGRPPRIFQWSIGLQRELARNLVVEASYVGNRGAWWTAPVLATVNYNALTPEGLKSQWGLDITNANDRNLLTLPLNSPAVIARFPQFANPNNVYPGFPGSQPLNQALRPSPQWGGVPPFLGPPLGTTWYDSLQVKATKRYSHGLDIQGAFTWQKELTNGANSDTSFFTPGTLVINDVFNHAQNKQISALSRPLALVVSFNYTTPKFKADGAGFKALSWAARDWTFGGVLKYQSGVVIQSPGSTNNLLTQLDRGLSNNPALFGGGNTLMNRVSGQSQLSVDPNCHCFDPLRTLPLNPAAYSDALPGQFGTAAAYYYDYRWQRQPQESLSIGRIFRVREKMTLQVRAEFQNIFNRVALTPPSVGGFGNTGPLSPSAKDGNGVYTSGYGFINMVPGATGYVESPRQGQLVARFQF